jgi:hypothetical protein
MILRTAPSVVSEATWFRDLGARSLPWDHLRIEPLPSHLGFVDPAIFQIARGPRYHQAFHDVTTGNNTVQFPPKTITGYQAAPGWDPVTGWGSPDAQVLIPLLARYPVP